MLRDRIQVDLNKAVRDKNKEIISTLRLVLAAMKDRDIVARSKGNNDGITEDEISLMLQTMIKQRTESAKIFFEAGRNDLGEKEENEISIISNFLPKQLTNNEILIVIEKTIKETQAKSMRDMGKIMGLIKQKYAGKCDFSEVSKIVKDTLMSN
tara:strand:- start:831 stop:1292 length:462 start_codon:yes stop_codon:yes gene_type:complete